MKKSELRTMIREMLHEELAKMNDTKLTEATQTPSRYGETPLAAGTVKDAAYNVYLSTDFEDALAIDGGIMGDECAAVIADAAARYWPSANAYQQEQVRQQLEIQLARILGDDGVKPVSNTVYDPDVQRILGNHFDKFGNRYDD